MASRIMTLAIATVPPQGLFDNTVDVPMHALTPEGVAGCIQQKYGFGVHPGDVSFAAAGEAGPPGEATQVVLPEAYAHPYIRRWTRVAIEKRLQLLQNAFGDERALAHYQAFVAEEAGAGHA